MQTHTGYVSADEIIADVTSIAVDDEMREFSPGWYISQVQQALTELAYDTYFDDREWEALIPKCLEIELPSGLFNITNVYVFSGNNCGIGYMQNVHYARNYIRKGGAMFKEQRGVNGEPVMDPVIRPTTAAGPCFYNTRNGKLTLSDACLAYEKVFVTYKGLGCDFGSAPIIPHYLRDAVKWWVAHEALNIRSNREPGRWDRALDQASRKLHGDGRPSNPGAWLSARRRVQAIDEKAGRDIQRYIKSMNSDLF